MLLHISPAEVGDAIQKAKISSLLQLLQNFLECVLKQHPKMAPLGTFISEVADRVGLVLSSRLIRPLNIALSQLEHIRIDFHGRHFMRPPFNQNIL